LPPELLAEVEGFILKKRRYGYATKEEFIEDAIRVRLCMLTDEYEYIEIPREKYILLGKAVRELNLPAISAEGYVDYVIDETLENYRKWLQQSGQKPEITEEDKITYGWKQNKRLAEHLSQEQVQPKR